MKLRKTIAIIVALCLVLALGACAKDRDIRTEQTDREAQLEQTQTAEPVESQDENGEQAGDEQTNEEDVVLIPTAKSDDVEMYISTDADGVKHVVNYFGTQSTLYIVDEDGNICKADGSYVVMAENASEFKSMSNLAFRTPSPEVTLQAEEVESKNDENVTIVRQNPVNITLVLTANVTDATNRIVILETKNPAVADIRANANAKLLVDGAFDLGANQTAIQLSDTGTARIIVTAKSAGEVEIYAKSLSGDSVSRCLLTVRNGELEVEEGNEADLDEFVVVSSDDPTVHTHVYTKTVVEPTQYEGGYTEYTCACGHSYRDNYTDPLPAPDPTPTAHVHVYESTVVAPTATERGYTLHVCECGDSYKDSYVDPTGTN